MGSTRRLLILWALAMLASCVAAERPAEAAGHEPSRTLRTDGSKVNLSRMRGPKPKLASAPMEAEEGEGEEDDEEGGAVADSRGKDGLVVFIRRLVRALLRFCLKLLGMDALLAAPAATPAAAIAGASTSSATPSAAANEPKAVEEEGAGAAVTPGSKEASATGASPGKSRLQSLLGAKRAPAGATDDDAAGEEDGAARALSPQAQHLVHVGFSPKFAEAMSQRMSAGGKRPPDLNTPWARHLLQQLVQLRGKDRDPLVRVQPPAQLSEWVVEVTGAPGSLYEGERYKLQFNFDRSYPASPPRVRFLRPVPKHEHVYSDGKICLNILYSDWKPEMTVLGVSQSLISMMASAVEKKRPPDNAATIMNSIHQDPSKMQWIFHDDKC